jgi:hypothetical protein
MPAAPDPKGPRPHVRTPADVRHVLVTEIESLAANPDLDPIGRARALAALARAVLQAMEVETFAARVEAIESALKRRRAAHTTEEQE